MDRRLAVSAKAKVLAEERLEDVAPQKTRMEVKLKRAAKLQEDRRRIDKQRAEWIKECGGEEHLNDSYKKMLDKFEETHMWDIDNQLKSE